MAKINPNSPCPIEILSDIASLEIDYIDFCGNKRTGLIEVNQSAISDVRDFFELAYELKFPINLVTLSSNPDFSWDDNKIMAANASTGFNYRKILGTNRLSLHSKGLAFDINPAQNPYNRYQSGQIVISEPFGSVYNPNLPGTLNAEHPLVAFMINRGWEWGGNWLPESGRIDYQHFQKVE